LLALAVLLYWSRDGFTSRTQHDTVISRVSLTYYNWFSPDQPLPCGSTAGLTTGGHSHNYNSENIDITHATVDAGTSSIRCKAEVLLRVSSATTAGGLAR
jgi:hypothetical protein